jgi:hypothetical protein
MSNRLPSTGIWSSGTKVKCEDNLACFEAGADSRINCRETLTSDNMLGKCTKTPFE